MITIDQPAIDLAEILAAAEALRSGANAPTETRLDHLRAAMAAGAKRAVLIAIAAAIRVRRDPTIVLPAHKYESLSRGKGWCRKGKGASAEWGNRVDGGYEVGPGRWTVGSNDGYARKGESVWNVKNIAVGGETWTVAT